MKYEEWIKYEELRRTNPAQRWVTSAGAQPAVQKQVPLPKRPWWSVLCQRFNLRRI